MLNTDRDQVLTAFKELVVEPQIRPDLVTELLGRQDFAFRDGRLVESTPDDGLVTLYTNPTGAAQLQLLETLDIADHTLASVFDVDEIARIEYDVSEKMTVVVWKRPYRGSGENPEVLRLSSVGLFLRENHLTIVTTDDAPLLHVGDRAGSAQDVLLRIMAVTVNEFLVELNGVKRTSREIQTRLTKSIENRELLRMFSLSEGLVYHINAIDANGGVLRKMRAISPRLGFDEVNIELLEDIVIDNNQASRQGQVFSTVLAGMLDARGNIINNNMNVLLKNLTIVNVIFLPLGVIAGMGGMSEFSMMLDHYSVDWRVGYAGFTTGLTLLGLILWFIVSSFVNKKWRR
jgi:magnesium transporter